MIRNILAVVIAFVLAGVCVFVVEAIGHKVYPLPETVDTNDMKSIAEYVKTAPIGAILFVLLAQCLGSLVGGFVTGLIASSHHKRLAIIYGVLALIMASLNLVLIPVHPIWFMILSLVLPIPLSLLGSTLAQSFNGGREDKRSTMSM